MGLESSAEVCYCRINFTNANYEPMPSPRGIQSIEVGGRLLQALAGRGTPMPLKDLAHAAAMTPAKAHPYLVSFAKLGLVEQDEVTGRYGLGPFALQLGLIGLAQQDPVRLAFPVVEQLAQQLGHTVAVAVWGEHGPVIVRVAEAPSPIHVVMRHGTVLSLTGTASGWLFAAYLDEAVVGPLRPRSMPRAEWDAEVAQVRQRGLARAVNRVVEGVAALSAPVFDVRGRIALGLTAIGPTASFDARWDGVVAQPLRAAAAALSQRLGALPEAA
jgi:DNA-binding IclR family transcriptional regulator